MDSYCMSERKGDLRYYKGRHKQFSSPSQKSKQLVNSRWAVNSSLTCEAQRVAPMEAPCALCVLVVTWKRPQEQHRWLCPTPGRAHPLAEFTDRQPKGSSFNTRDICNARILLFAVTVCFISIKSEFPPTYCGNT